jgi:phosphoglycerate dehydrogenase-like enzyme
VRAGSASFAREENVMPARKIDLILVAYELLETQHLDAIRAAAPGVELAVVPPSQWEKRRSELASRVEVVLGMLAVDDLRALPKLGWLQQTGAGADWLLRAPDIAKSGLVLTNASGVHAIPIAEHILALMFVLSRRMHRFVKAQQAHEWFRRGRLGELDGATLGIVGLGAIGAKTAEKARGIGMRVIGLRRDPAKPCAHVERTYGPDGLGELLAQSDWVAICAALTPETRHLIGERELRRMKPSAYLINIARGSVIDEPALVRALQEEWIAGAGLDVFEREPLPADSLLWDMRNVVITPHFAGATPFYSDRVIEIFCDNLRRYQAGDTLLNVVDKQLAY